MKTIKELQAARAQKREAVADIENKLNSFDEILLNRELNDDEKKQQRECQTKLGKAQREYAAACRDLNDAINDAQAKGLQREPQRNANVILREYLKGVREGKQSREIVLNGKAGDTTGVIADGGAVNLTIHDIIPTLNSGLNLPEGMTIVTGVTGNEVWPVSADDVKMTEAGEVEALANQVLNFDKITVTPRRVGLRVRISNTAIDNAAFDLLAFVQQKATLALRKYIAEKLYSQADWDGNKGPFSGLTPASTITLDATAYKNILEAVATFVDAGYDPQNICLVVDAATEADLKATPKAAGQGGFIIEDGKLAGYNYVVTPYINTTLDSDKKSLKATTDRFIGIGLFNYEVIEQHGQVRMTVDSTSEAVAASNVTSVVINMEMSFTNISAKNRKQGKKDAIMSAFALYKVAQPAAGAGAGA